MPRRQEEIKWYFMMQYEFFWRHAKDGGVCLLRVYGQTEDVYVPNEIEGCPVTEIGAYCFAGRNPNSEYEKRTIYKRTSGESDSSEDFSAEETVTEGMRELSGKAVKRVSLPKCLKKIGSYAFYQCTELTEISLGKDICDVGGDAFMNCHKLHHMIVHGGYRVMAGIRQILSQVSSDMHVVFRKEGEVEACLLFPEYYESYDEIAPAHLFGRNIEGEGFRARQCVREGNVDFRLYDTIFPKACAKEREQTLCQLAMNRLRYPVELGENERKLYEIYVKEHVKTVCEGAVCTKEEDIILFLCEQGLIAATDIDLCIRIATEQEWAKGVAAFLRMKEEFFVSKTVEERYSFDDF